MPITSDTSKRKTFLIRTYTIYIFPSVKGYALSYSKYDNVLYPLMIPQAEGKCTTWCQSLEGNTNGPHGEITTSSICICQVWLMTELWPQNNILINVYCYHSPKTRLIKFFFRTNYVSRQDSPGQMQQWKTARSFSGKCGAPPCGCICKIPHFAHTRKKRQRKLKSFFNKPGISTTCVRLKISEHISMSLFLLPFAKGTKWDISAGWCLWNFFLLWSSGSEHWKGNVAAAVWYYRLVLYRLWSKDWMLPQVYRWEEKTHGDT